MTTIIANRYYWTSSIIELFPNEWQCGQCKRIFHISETCTCNTPAAIASKKKKKFYISRPSTQMTDTNECSICMNDIESDWQTTNCNHIFHNKCLSEWLEVNNSCPLCRSKCT